MTAETRPRAYEIPSTAIALHFARLARRPHEHVKLVRGGYVACPGCKRLLNADEFLNEPCEEKTDG